MRECGMGPCESVHDQHLILCVGVVQGEYNVAIQRSSGRGGWNGYGRSSNRA